MKLTTQIIVFIGLLIFLSSFESYHPTPKISILNSTQIDSVLVDSINIPDSISMEPDVFNYIPFKENAHASYYADKFNGRKTANGDIFNNNLFTAAHKTLVFGTKIKVTNTVNGESIIVTVNDRGPFVKDREIDLSKAAFMEIAKHKQRGHLIVHLDILDN